MNFLRSFLAYERPANKVENVRSDTFSSRQIHFREDGLILYGPETTSKNKTDQKYEIVLHRPTTETLYETFSLYRTEDQGDAEIKFLTFKDKIPVLIEAATRELLNVQGLQKICDALNEHPSWSLAHLAAYFSLHDAFINPEINSFLNSTDDVTGMSPLQVAITSQNAKTVEILVASKCSLEHLDHSGNSVFHYAASTSKEIIGMLTQGTSPACLNSQNKDGLTPLHKACQADKVDCVYALLLAGADVNKTANITDTDNLPASDVSHVVQSHKDSNFYQKDIKFGGTPLHWASSKSVIEALIDMNCSINLVNFENKTALHIMVLRNRLECVVALLSRGADADLGDSDGNRPIHLAAMNGNISIIQALIVFGAELDVLNNKGETARHLIGKDQEAKVLYYLAAVGARRCFSDMAGCTEGCSFSGTFEGIPPPTVNGPLNRDILNQMLAVSAMEVASAKHMEGTIPEKGRLLCLDGGGIRGLILVQSMLEIESVLGKPINHCFDWLAGTSTGGILALAIATGKTMKECLSLYFRLKETTFVGNRPYPSEPLENVLKETFGTDNVMADIKHPKVMITGVLADRKPVDLHLFRNYDSASNILGIEYNSKFENPAPPEKQLIWQVGRATGAAPTYFRSAFGRFLDGGLIANNPTLDALTEIHEHHLALKAVGRVEEACPVSVVVSLGTGSIPVSEYKSLDISRPEFKKILDSAKLLYGIKELGSLVVDQATQSDGRVIDRARAWCSSIGVPYFRFSPLMSEEFSMDEKSDEKLCKMLWETKVYMRNRITIIQELVDILNR